MTSNEDKGSKPGVGVAPGTPLPWVLPDLGEIGGANGDLIALTTSSGNIGQDWQITRERGPYPNVPAARANARYIVTACNAFPELVGALKEARGQVVGFMLDCGHSPEVAVANVARLDAAIAKATGGAA